MLIVLIEILVMLFGLMGLGMLLKYIASKWFKWIERIVDMFTKVLYYGLLPLLFFNIFYTRGLDIADVNISIIVTVYVFVSIGLLWYTSRKLDPGLRKSLVMSSIFSNAIFLGFPILYFLYNDITYASLYSLVLLSYNIAIGGLLGAEKNIAKNIAKIPLIYGFTAGVLAHYYAPWIGEPIVTCIAEPVSKLTTYGSIIIVGFSIPLTTHVIRKYWKLILLQGLFRYTISPLIHYVLLLALPIPVQGYYQLMVESIMPPGLINTVLARIHGWNHEYAASATLVLTLTTPPTIILLRSIGLI